MPVYLLALFAQQSVQQGRLHLKHRWQVCGGLDLSLFVDVQPSECYIYGRRGDAQFSRQKPDHMTENATAARFGRHADLELCALGLTSNIPARTGFTQNVDQQRVSFHQKERLIRFNHSIYPKSLATYTVGVAWNSECPLRYLPCQPKLR
ncbi:hypothetical protein BBC27_11130 [Acidithiobacillus ferrivorans]|uniref:Uncharacterized protein n=1 Tax=Acidithiobacillus ferrivorans TaxID=160808 RepID=A0A1B9BYS2_9PROT|nr:hypothetical protein BBC27_11130 [Acidithiobacillus ferrivorans]